LKYDYYRECECNVCGVNNTLRTDISIVKHLHLNKRCSAKKSDTLSVIPGDGGGSATVPGWTAPPEAELLPSGRTDGGLTAGRVAGGAGLRSGACIRCSRTAYLGPNTTAVHKLKNPGMSMRSEVAALSDAIPITRCAEKTQESDTPSRMIVHSDTFARVDGVRVDSIWRTSKNNTKSCEAVA
jgi:hypothetical protein